MTQATPQENETHRRKGPQWNEALLDAAEEVLKFVRANLPAVRHVMARISDLLPPQIDEEEVAAHLVLKLAEGIYDPSVRRDPAGWLWQEALAYLRSHPVVKAAARWLHAGTEADMLTDEQLRAIALALTVFGFQWLPQGDEMSEEILARAMTRLPTEERLALAMYYFEGLTLPEIAEALDIAPDEASALYASAIRHLKQNVALVAADMKHAPGHLTLPRAA